VEAEGAEEAGVEQEGNGANPGGGPRAAEEVEVARGCAGVSGGVEVDETRTGSAGSATVRRCRGRRSRTWLCGEGVTRSCREKLLHRSDRSWHSVSSIQKLKILWCGRGAALSKGKSRLVEGDMTRDDHPVRGEIKAAVPFMVSGISQEDT